MQVKTADPQPFLSVVQRVLRDLGEGFVGLAQGTRHFDPHAVVELMQSKLAEHEQELQQAKAQALDKAGDVNAGQQAKQQAPASPGASNKSQQPTEVPGGGGGGGSGPTAVPAAVTSAATSAPVPLGTASDEESKAAVGGTAH